MPKFTLHVEKQSRFIRSLCPICPCERVEFGVFDCLTLVAFFAAFVGIVNLLAE